MATTKRSAKKTDNNETDIIFCEGVRVFAPHDNAPDFVIATVIITPRELVDWIKENSDVLVQYKEEKQLNLQLLESKAGDLYFAVNAYGSEREPAKAKQVASTKRSGKKAETQAGADDLLF
jgi:hypothetical protein